MITATQARKIMEETLESRLKDLSTVIKLRANLGYNHVDLISTMENVNLKVCMDDYIQGMPTNKNLNFTDDELEGLREYGFDVTIIPGYSRGTISW